MELKTKVHAEDGRQEYVITREFELPVELLFRAYAEAEIVEQWMGTKVLKLESNKGGAYQFQTRDKEGNVVFQASGVIHEFIPDGKITRTFEMENAGAGVQLELYQFEAIDEDHSKLTMQVIYESVDKRDKVLGFGLAKGVSWAHKRLEEIAKKLK
jgi:uncharacterized protein YndB with AHSA1/START domain